MMRTVLFFFNYPCGLFVCQHEGQNLEVLFLFLTPCSQPRCTVYFTSSFCPLSPSLTVMLLSLITTLLHIIMLSICFVVYINATVRYTFLS